MDRLGAREKKLASQLQKIDEKRKKLVRELQLTRMRIAGARRKAQSKVNRGVAALLAKADPSLYEKLSQQLGGPKRGGRGRRKKAG